MTVTVPSQSRYTPADVLRLDGEGLFELVGRRLIKKEMSSLASETAGLITAALNTYLKRSRSGNTVFLEQTFQCFPYDPDLVRRPDVAMIVASRLAGVPEKGHIPIAPDLAVQVILPDDTIYEFEQRLVDYQRAKIPLVWEVNPKLRFVRIHRLDRDAERLNESAMLTTDTVLPGFSVIVSGLFPPASVAKA